MTRPSLDAQPWTRRQARLGPALGRLLRRPDSRPAGRPLRDANANQGRRPRACAVTQKQVPASALTPQDQREAWPPRGFSGPRPARVTARWQRPSAEGTLAATWRSRSRYFRFDRGHPSGPKSEVDAPRFKQAGAQSKPSSRPGPRGSRHQRDRRRPSRVRP